MRLSIELLLKDDTIEKDKNRIIMHIIKTILKEENKNIFNELYKDNISNSKDLTFSMYLGKDAEFLRDEIIIPSGRIIINLSTSNPVIGITLYNSFVKHRGLDMLVKENKLIIGKVDIIPIRPITKEEARFVAKAPIVIRSHHGDNKQTYYYSLREKRGEEVFLENLKHQINEKFPTIKKRDLDEIKLNILWSKDVKVKHYGIVILSNLCEFEMEAKTYILEELYLNGTGSRKSQGFGYLDLIE